MAYIPNLAQSTKRHMKLAGYARWSRAFMALVVLTSLCIPSLSWIGDIKAYALSPEVQKLIGSANENLSAKFTFDNANNRWQFNKDGLASLAQNIAKVQGEDAEGIGGALSQLAAKQVGGNGKKDTSLYSVDLPANAKEGITYFDNVTRLSFRMVPNFAARDAKMVDGRIVYPFSDGGQIIYTAKSNGLKEDIVLSKYLDNTLHYSYTLDLPETLEARLLDDGSVGVYSASPALFGNISFGNDEDQAKVMEARKNGTKDNLVFGIPAPFIKDQNGQAGHTRYELDGNRLTVVAGGLDDLRYPLTVDPSVIVTSSTDFQTGNDEGMINFDTSGQVTRGGLTGGTTGTWDNAGGTAFTTKRASHASVAYNGYIYILGGTTTATQLNDVQYAPIDGSGNVGTWQATSSFTNARNNVRAVAYNGYMYLLGGNSAGTSTLYNDVQFAPINANGTLGTWQYTYNSASSGSFVGGFTNGRYGHTVGLYNGYLYVMGGCTNTNNGLKVCQTVANDVQYAPVNANGTVGTWANANTGAAFTTRYGHRSVAYNGYMYVMGGCTSVDGLGNCNGLTNATQYARINSSGTLEAWVTSTNTFTTARDQFTAVVYNGYLYVSGGDATLNDVQYAQINANGTIGTWSTTTTYDTAGRYGHAATHYKGYLYIVGGCNNNAVNCNSGNSYLTDTRKAKINSAGATRSYSSGTYDTVRRLSFASVVYNNYVYMIGGTTGNTGARADMLNTTRYAPINADGSVGTWSTTATGFNQINSGSTPQTCSSGICPGRVNVAAGAYNGYMYIAGGVSNGTIDQWSDVQSAVICTGVNTPVAGCAGAGDLRNWTTIFTDYLTNSTTTYTEANGRSQVSMTIYNGTMYLIGGANSAGSHTPYAHIYQSTLTSSGGAGNFSLSSVSLPSARSGAGSFVYNNQLYVVGGGTSGGVWSHVGNDFSDVQFIPLNSDGTLDGVTGWKDANAVINGGSGSSFSAANSLNSYSVVVNNAQIYVIGGRITNTEQTTVYKASINTNGSVSSWSTTASLGTGRVSPKAVTTRGYIYVVGGCSAPTALIGQSCSSVAGIETTYEHTRINNGGGGAPISWTSANTFTGARYYHGTVAMNGYLYVIGGCTAYSAGPGCTAVATDYSYAPINSNGSLGSWTQVTGAIPSAVYNMGTVAVNGYVYLIGGCGAGACSTYRNIVQYAPINSNGTLGSWGSPGTGGTFDGSMVARWGVAATYYDGYIYAAGGAGSGGSLNDVWSAQVNSDGTLGAWQSAGTGFTTARYIPAAVAHKGYLYIIGGHSDSAASSVYSDVQFRPIGSSGTLTGSWSATRSFPEAAGAINATTYNGYMYLSGGYTSSSTATSITRYAAISSNGHLGQWNVASGYSTARAGTGGAIYNGYMYATGGYNGSPFNLVDYASIDVQSRVGRYSKLVQVSSAVEVASVYYNGSLGDGSSVTYKVAPVSGIFGSTSTALEGSGSEPTPKCGAGAIYYVQVTLVMDDAYNAVFSDETSQSNVTDVTIYYRQNATPPPDLRLNGGKWFYANVEQALDTCEQ